MDDLSSHPVQANAAVITNLPGNNICVDCSAPRPEWASLGFGGRLIIESIDIDRLINNNLSFS